MYSFYLSFFCVKTIYATEDNFLEYSTHQLTRIYNGTEIDYQQGLEIKQNYLNDSPTITVLTHGFGNDATCWSNDVNITSSQWYKYNSHSLINKLFIKANGNLNIYYIDSSPVSESDRYSFVYKKITYNNYQNSHQGVETAMIDDVSKHVVVVFNSSNSQMNNDNSYSEFHQLMDEISMQYKMHTGKLPIFNLIGHSRGGIINLKYATEHIYNVKNLISIGTPYNGSTLGYIDPLLNLMRFTNTEQILSSGGIMNEASNISIRNLWNANYTEDADVNVIAYGALTSIDLFKEMINDIENDVSYATTYGSIISDYKNLINTVINIADAYPSLTSNILNFASGIAEVTNMFGVDLFDNVITNITPSLEGQITTEEVSKVIDLVQVIDGEFIIADDLFIDTNSQLGLGFSDNIAYNGFKRYVKIFDEEDYTDNRAIPNQPGIPHNLEIYDFEIVDSIVSSVVLGTNNTSKLEFCDDENITIAVNGKRAIEFSPDYSGIRNITASNSIITIYKYTENLTLTKVMDAYENISYDFNYNESYLIVLSYYLLDELTIQFNLIDTVILGNNTIVLESNEKRIFKINNMDQGYYLISSSDESISLENAIEYDENEYYKYIDNGADKYITLLNNSNEIVSASISISPPLIQTL